MNKITTFCRPNRFARVELPQLCNKNRLSGWSYRNRQEAIEHRGKSVSCVLPVYSVTPEWKKEFINDLIQVNEVSDALLLWGFLRFSVAKQDDGADNVDDGDIFLHDIIQFDTLSEAFAYENFEHYFKQDLQAPFLHHRLVSLVDMDQIENETSKK